MINKGILINNNGHYFASTQREFFWNEYLDANNGHVFPLMTNTKLLYLTRAFKSI